MDLRKYSHDALVLLGHGSTQHEDSGAPVYQHAAELRRRGIFAEVREAFWKQPPQVKHVLAEIAAPRVFIVPLLISEGYFCNQVIPRELGFATGQSTVSRPPQTFFYGKPVGTHDSMTEVLLSRARAIVQQFPFPRTPQPGDISLFVAGHGTERYGASRQAIERQVDLIRARKVYASVHAVYLDEAPRIAECYVLAKTRNIVMVPFFISDGLHCAEDIPVLLGEPERTVKARQAAGQPTWRNPTERQHKLVWYAPAIGSEPHIADIILERVEEVANAAADPPKHPG